MRRNVSILFISLTLLFAAAFSALVPATALAGGYNSTETIQGGGIPHGGFTTTGNKCKSCHAVHVAEGSYRLLRGNSAATACDYCHGSAGIITKKAWLDPYGHGTTQTVGNVVAPDDTTVTQFPVVDWGCTVCHSVHNSNTIVLDGAPDSFTTSKLLKKAPNAVNKTYPLSYSGYSSSGTSQTVTLWCTNCHEGNFGLHTDTRTVDGQNRWGHDTSTTGFTTGGDGWALVTPGDSINRGPRCEECHPADGAPAAMTQKFPHAGGYDESSPTAGGEKMLKSGARVTQLDGVCTASPCHNTVSLP